MKVTLSEFDMRVVSFHAVGLTAAFNEFEETGTGDKYNLHTSTKVIGCDPEMDNIKKEFKFLAALSCGLYGNINTSKKLSSANQEFVDTINSGIEIKSISIEPKNDGYSVEVNSLYKGPYGLIKINTPKVRVTEEEGIKSTSGKYLFDSVTKLKKEVYG